jgi:FkbM family methyltransferase
MLGGRSLSMILREVFRPRNYLALVRMVVVYPAFPVVAWRYFAGRGSYPWRCRVRTPVGTVAPTLFSAHDMFTVNEIFCRGDYAADPPARTVVDIGSNIGISALYFLTRGVDCRCLLHEPVPQNVERLRGNLAGLEDRYELRPVAVAADAGTVEFGVEGTGRYGGIGVQTGSSIEVDTVPIDQVLEAALARSETIDVLKMDTEGTELELLGAASPDLLGKVRQVFLESADRSQRPPEPFSVSFRNDTWVLRNRAL